MSGARILGLCSLAFLGACHLDLDSGQLRCSVPDSLCPSGFHCAFDDTCWRDGLDPESPADLAGVDFYGVDLYGLVKPNGASCAASGECTSGICSSEGVCCNTSCEGTCESCKTSAASGTCTHVQGLPVPGRSCGGDTAGPCIGLCTGSSSMCDFPSSSQLCGSDCKSTCDGKGTCVGATGSSACPGNFACGATACKTSCASKADCAGQFICDVPTGKCVYPAESDCFNGSDDNGDGKADCADPTCIGGPGTPAIARCVPLPPSNVELGVLTSDGSCNAGGAFPKLSAALHQQLIQPSCSSCGACQPFTECLYRIDFYSDNKCTGVDIAANVGLRLVYPQQCAAMVDPPLEMMSFGSVKIDDVDPVQTKTCAAASGTTATKSAPTWASSLNFCLLSATPQATGCPINQACLPVAQTQPLCQRASGQNLACASGYPNVPGGDHTFYGGAEDQTLCTCSCATGGTDVCPLYVDPWVAYDAPDCTGSKYTEPNMAMLSSCPSFGGMLPLSHARLQVSQTLTGQACSSTTGMVGAATPSLPSTICCE